ncbi:hypothetical protein [Ovoidimarina sediminis]|uniref:hypothetical protein n=1 Tax=Ovoidimarina sediminis TaxID=3079856 RepID=UPI002931D60C|nr:hypothetical protein [Rhodophyticola sp. MJ-SS7]
MWRGGRLAVAAVLAGLAGPALALSCLPPDPVRLYTEARDSADPYRIVSGRFDRVPDAGAKAEDAPVTFEARLKGRSLGRLGFSAPFDSVVAVELTCLSVWCAPPPEAGHDLLVAVREDGQRQIVSLGPCPSNALPLDAAGEQAVVDCHRSGLCASK